MENKIRMKRHESFSIREGWLAKGIRAVAIDSKSFSSANSTDILGIGTNMVKSLKYWLIATNLVKEKNRGLELTELGELISQYDPYFEDDFTWWMTHLFLITNIKDAFIFNYFFNKIGKNFSKKDVYEIIADDLKLRNIEYNENTLVDEINMVVKTYVIEDKISNPENNFSSPLSELLLIKKVNKDKYEKTKPNTKKLHYLLVYELLLLILGDKNYINIDELSKIENNPLNIFNIDKNILNEYLDDMKRNGLITINRTAGLNMVYINKKLDLNEVFEEYFNI